MPGFLSGSTLPEVRSMKRRKDTLAKENAQWCGRGSEWDLGHACLKKGVFRSRKKFKATGEKDAAFDTPRLAVHSCLRFGPFSAWQPG